MKKWKQIRLGDCIEEINERTTENNQYQVLSVTKDGIFSQEEFFKKQIASENNIGYKVIRKNNLVFSTMNLWMGSLDVLTKYEIGIVSPAYKIFEFNEKLMLPSYGNYFMKSHYMLEQYKNCSEQGASIVRRNLDLEALLNTIILIPSKTEQKKIVSIISKVDRIINDIKDNENLLIREKRFLMSTLFSDVLNQGEELEKKCVFFSGGTPNSKDKSLYEGNIPFIRSAEIDSDKTELFINDEALSKSSAKKVKKGDLLMALYGANSGNVAISKIDGAINQAILCIRSEKINIKYLKFILEYDQENIIRKYLQGGQGNLSGNIIKKLKYKFPTNKIQNKSVAILTNMEEKIRLVHELGENYEQIKKGLMQKLLTGKVRVNV